MSKATESIVTPNGAAEKKEVGKLITVVPSTPQKSEKLLPLEDRLLKFDMLLEKRKKYDRLNQSKVRLNEFRQKKEGETITLSLTDYNNRGIEFSTKNPEVIQIVIDTLKKTIDQKILELEPQLTW